MTRWLDFSGAPPLLIPKRLVKYWRGCLHPATGAYSELNSDDPVTDYDRACEAAWPGRGVLTVNDGSALVLYSEFDEHGWDNDRKLVVSGSWLPSNLELAKAVWSDPVNWATEDSEYLLMNSAASGVDGLDEDDFMEVHLSPGRYVIEYTYLEADLVGIFHRFTRNESEDRRSKPSI